MLAAAMRRLLTAVVLLVLGGAVLLGWLAARGPDSAQAARIAEVLTDPAPADEPPAYAHCVSCHLHDGSGRPDGSIPRLTGQRKAVLANKLHRLRNGMMKLPVMEPYARTLPPDEVTEIATYLSELPELELSAGDLGEADRTRGAALFTEHCAACHGANGEGSDPLFASRLCGQYPGYLERRLEEAAAGSRGDADAIMQGVVAAVPAEDLPPIVAWLGAGKGCATR